MEERKPRAKKNGITRERVIECAFDELKENGWECWNARQIARRAGCSTMPIFRLFGSMDELKKEVIARALKVYEEYIYGGMREDKPYKGTGRAYIRFAKEQPRLFKALCVTEEFTGQSFAAIDPTIGRVMREAEKAGDVRGEKRKKAACLHDDFCARRGRDGGKRFASCAGRRYLRSSDERRISGAESVL